LLLTGQGVHSLLRQLAEAVFNTPDRIIGRAPDVGAGSVSRISFIPNGCWCCGRRDGLGQPVKWIAERGEEFISLAQGRDNHTRARLARLRVAIWTPLTLTALSQWQQSSHFAGLCQPD
jgi:aerobic carbon-monoxide dehydrogenase large subunit